MMCPVCKRELAPTLSICFTCGAMVNDSVREELQLKIERISGPLDRRPAPPVKAERSEPAEAMLQAPEIQPEPVETIAVEPPIKPVRTETTEFGNKKTSPTLVGFQPKNASVPDWRLQLQNSVRQRKSEGQAPPAGGPAPPTIQRHLATNGSTAIKAQYVEEPEKAEHADPRVASALKRIEDSRRRFLPGQSAAAAAAPAREPSQKNYPFNVVSRSADVAAAPSPGALQATVNTPPKPRLVASLKIEKKKYDTNKLPPIAETRTAAEAAPISIPDEPLSISLKVPAAETAMPPVEAELLPIEDAEFTEEIDDLAAFSSRFLAGLFDVIVGGFATAIVLSPLLVSERPWLTLPGVLTITASFAIVMFVYLTLSIGLRTRTLGMKLFSLEIVDAEENEYLTIHQAAVNSALFLLTIPLLGVGFVPAFFNEERRAAHDLVSGTILVKEI